MCGIAGWIDWRVDLTKEASVMERMGASLAHRGPDASGVSLCKEAAFAHRRLGAIDPDGGTQPMERQVEGKRYVIVADAEVYNARWLRTELRRLGYTLRTECDAEVLLHAYIAWGPACVRQLNGVFAFAIWDAAAQRLFAARDRLGVKPFFYAQRGSAFLFGSELKALLAHPAVEPVVGREGLAEVFALGPARTPGHGVFNGIHELKPGHWLEYDRAGLRIRPYWRLESRGHTDDPEETAERIRELLADAVERQSAADAPVGLLLSGGLDSSAVSAFAARVFRKEGKPLHSFSVDFVENEKYFQSNPFQPHRDGPWIEVVSRFLGTEHETFQIDSLELVEHLGEAVRARDLPGMADIDTSLYLFCRAIRERAAIALSGEAADEIFGGYPWFHRPEALAADTFPWSLSLTERLRWLDPGLIQAIEPEAYVAARYREALAEVPRLEGEDAESARLREINYLSISRFMPTLIDRNDRMSAAAGMQIRVPFCDHRLVEYVWNVPWPIRRYGGQPKGILRRALQGLLPERVLQRKKSPFPKTYHPAYFAAARDLLLERLGDPASPLRDLVNVQEIEAMAREEVTASGRPWFGQLMGRAQAFAYLLQVDIWLREYGVRIAL